MTITALKMKYKILVKVGEIQAAKRVYNEIHELKKGDKKMITQKGYDKFITESKAEHKARFEADSASIVLSTQGNCLKCKFSDYSHCKLYPETCTEKIQEFCNEQD